MIDHGTKSIKILAAAPLVFLVLGTLAGIFWMFQNITSIPQYGDTSEYLELSKVMKVDQYRGILYPVVLKFSSSFSSTIGLPPQVIVYFMQVLVAVFAVYSLANLLLQNSPSSKIISALASIAVIFNPLVAHFSLALMTDSLATSFTLIFSVFLVRGCFTDVLPAKRFLYLAFAAIAFVLMATTRVEKLYLASLIFLGCCISLVTVKFRFPNLRRAAASSLLAIVFFAAAMGTSIYIKKETTVYNMSRPPLNFYSMAFNRVVWPRMSDVYDFFPDSLKQEITPGEAKQFDSHANFVYPFLVKTLGKYDGVEQINSITLLALEHFPIHVIGRIFFDFLKYSAPNFTFPMEAVEILPESAGTSWTISRMQMFTPVLSRALLLIGSVQFFVLFAFVLFMNRPREIAGSTLPGPFNWKSNFESPFTFWVLGAIVLLNSGMFTLSAGMDAHIRYALPTYTIIQTVVVAYAIAGIFAIFGKAKNQTKQFPARSEN